MDIDLILASIRLLACYLLSKNLKSGWLISITATILKITILQSINLKILAFGKLMGLVISIFAWKIWKKQEQEERSSPQSIFNSNPQFIVFCGLIAILTAYLLMQQNHHLEMVICLFNFSAYGLAAYRKRECWVIWIAYDILLANLFLEKNMILSAITTYAYIPIALLGNQTWSHKENPLQAHKQTN